MTGKIVDILSTLRFYLMNPWGPDIPPETTALILILGSLILCFCFLVIAMEFMNNGR